MIQDGVRLEAEGREKTGHGLRWYWTASVVGMACLVLVVWGIVYLQLLGLERGVTDRQLLSGAEALAGRLAEINRLRKELLGALAKDSGLVAHFKEDDKAALLNAEKELTHLIPDAMQVRLLPIGINEPDRRYAPHLGFASLQQFRQAEQKFGVLPAEVHQFGTSQQHISVVVSVRDKGIGPAVGLMHVAFPLKTLQDALASVQDYGGRVEVRQLAPKGEVLSLAQNGLPGLGQEPPADSLKVDGSIWQVTYWPSGNHWMTWQNGLFFLMAPLLLALLAGLLFFFTESARKALKRDQRSILSLVEGMLMGRPPKHQLAQLADMQPTLDVLHHQVKEHRAYVAERQRNLSPFKTGVEAPAGVVAQVKVDDKLLPPITHEAVDVSASIFRAYDIRGIVGDTLTAEVVNLLGQSIGSEIFEKGLQSVVVGRDGRVSSEAMHSALIAGLQSSGREVIDVGMVPTPVLYFAAEELQVDCGVMVTGSHNPKEYNGLKVVVQGEAMSPQAIQDLRRRIDAGQLLRGAGSFDSREIIPEYIERIVSDVRLARPMKLVIDCGNGVASVAAAELYRQLGCEVIELFCEVDGSFPNHHPDPSQPANMQALQQAVLEHQADVGLAFDGDGDRIGVVDSTGKLIWPDRILMYLAIDILMREPGGDIIYDVKCSRHLANVVLANGGRPLMWKSGHSMLKAKLRETHALLAGEFSGHIIFSERWYGFDDGLYAGARLLEILSLDYRSSAEVFAELPESPVTPELSLPLPEGQSRKVMEALNNQPDIPGARMLRIDGLRAEFEQGWGLVRASNTAPALLFRFESETAEGLEQIQGIFRELISKVDPNLKLPF